ncbi:MAG: hypothetical protein KAI70_06100, partial [Candidatus Omnitrophica bacterium]|nr:hypothetical protein [Candidatus Omnitrophota bacterium]
MKKYLHKNIIRGFSVALTVCLFLRGVVWAAPSAGQVFKQNLAAESIFQNDMMSFSSIVPREEKVSDIDIFLSVLEIGKNLLPDPSQKETYIPLEYLEYVLRSEHEICGHVMPGLDLSRVNYYPGDSNIVLVPYKKEEQNNVMQIARRPLFLRNKMIGEEVNVSDKFDAKNFRGTYSEFLELVEKKEDDQIKEIHKELVEEPKKEGFLSFSQGTESGIRKPLFAGGKLNATVPVMVTHGINSMEQLIDALDFAATVVEVDVQMTSDGVFVAVWGEIDDGESRKCVYELTARELEKIMGKKLLRIEDVFKKVKGRCAVNLDIKDWSDRVPGYKTAMLDKMIDLIKQNGMEEDILASSFNSDFVSYLKTMLPSISVCIPVDRSFDVGSGLDIIMERVKKIGADTIILYLEQINKDVIEGIHAAGVRVAVNAVENSLSELPDRLIRECDFVYTEDVPVSSEQRQVSSKNILDMTHDEIFELMDPKYMEVRKHSLVAWEYAKVIARRLGHTDDEFLNMLRVICFAHDIGGVMGYPPDDKIDRKLLRIAREKGISYKNKDPEEVIKAFEKNGEILTEQEKKLVYSMDHPNNSLRLLDKNNIYVPKEVRFVISRHMDQITLKELRNLSGKERMLLKIFLVSDILECGNNPYKQVQRGRSETEDHNVTITFFLGWQTKSQVSMQDVVNAVECAEKAGEFKRAKTLSGSPVAEIPELFLGLKERELFMELKDGMEQLLEYGNRNKLELIFRQIAAFTRKDARYEKIKNAILRLSREYVIWTDNLSGEIEKVKEQLPLDEKKNLEILFADIRQSVKAKKDEQWAIVQAGGAGTRIWPKGDENLPKQLLEIERGKGSLLTQTILRNINENDPNSIYPSQIVIMTSERLEDKVWEDVKGLGILRKNIISQPENLDTGPALRIGALFIENKGGADAVIRVVNSDCIIQDCLKFNEAISRASDFAKLTNVVAEIGITPAKKANGEYIVNPKLGHQVLGIKIGEGIYSLLNRIEKEEKETCEETDKFYRELVEAGAKWNSGIIVVRAGVLSEMMREINPELENIFQRYKTDIIERRNLGGLFQDIRKLKVLISSQLPWEKKDKGHIGSSDRMLSVPLTEQKNPYFDIVCVTGVESDDWSDVGNLIELRNMAKVPEKMNFVAMGNEDDIIFEKGSFGNTVHASGDGTKIYIHRGVKNIIVAHEARNNALLLLPSRNYARVGDVPRRIKENPELKHLFPYVTGKNVPENVFVNEKKSDHRGNIIAGDAVFLEDTTDSCFFTNKGLIAAIDMHRYTVIWDENFREIHIYASEIPELIDKNIQAYKFSEKNREIFRRGKDFFVLQGT